MTTLKEIDPRNTEFVILSFEGPDQYSSAGGLGVRVTELADALATLGYRTRLVFVGDPDLPGEETRRDGNLTLHRWCQWISKYHPQGVYAGEDDKVRDFNQSIPSFVLEQIVKPATEAGKMVAILGEEWHTAEAMILVSDLLYYSGLRQKAIMVWNANNTMSFHRINWPRLSLTTTLMTVSRYMKHVMWDIGLNPLVVPNGIPGRLLDSIADEDVTRLQKAVNSDLFFFKIGRWDPDKRWNMAVESVSLLKRAGIRARLVMRGGIEPHEGEVLSNAEGLGLSVQNIYANGRDLESALSAIERAGDADLLNLKFFVPEDFLRVAYRSADAVLANSGHEPFGLVGLEVMAAQGLAFTGATGEDYAIPFINAMVLETEDPAEIVSYVSHLLENPDFAQKMREEGKHTARCFTWEQVIANLISKLEYIARRQGQLA